MAIRANHYDAAFEELLRGAGLPYVAVDETRRALFQESSLKSFDFVVSGGGERNLLVDVKGRRFPSAGGRAWENWSTDDDVASLLAWEQTFGAPFRSLLVFAYHVVDGRRRPELGELQEFRGRHYAYFGVWAAEYQAAMRRRSPRWQTVWLARDAFRELRFPVNPWLRTKATACV